MIPTLTINDVRAQQTLNDLRDALIGQGQIGDAATVLADEFRLLLKQVITLTPPHGLGQDAKRVGELAVTGDLKKLFTPVDEDVLNAIGSQFGVDGIDAWITGKPSGEKLHLLWDHIDPTGSGMYEFHQSHKNSRGRTRNFRRKIADAWTATYVVAKQDFQEYLAKTLSHVGRRKAGWAVGYMAMGGKVARWIYRHVNWSRGSFVSELNNPLKPFVAAFNSAPGITDDERIIRDAFRVRREAMLKRLQLITSGYSRDVAQKIRPRRRARATPESADATS